MGTSRLTVFLTISELSARSGAASSALRFYEGLGLISASRTAGNQRRYPQHMLRRVAFIRAGRRSYLANAARWPP
jgi:MerR family redox-sensitive transcriptional activator SoxR